MLLLVLIVTFSLPASFVNGNTLGDEIDNIAEAFLRWKFAENQQNHRNILGKMYSSSNTSDNSTDAEKVIPACKAFVNEYSDKASEFVRCSIDNARPFRFCEQCVVHYTKANNIYNDIVKNDGTMDNCQKILLMSDRVQVINSVAKSLSKIWELADCSKCFSSISEFSNGTVVYSLSQSTVDFLVMYENFTACIGGALENATYNATVCQKCRHYYQAMNSKFDSLLNDKTSPQHVCMDIVDMMNYTRLTWGQKLNCTVTHKEYAYVVTVTVILMSVPVAFYVTMAFIGTKKQRKLMKQKRLAPFFQNSYGALDSPRYGNIEYDVTFSQGQTGAENTLVGDPSSSEAHDRQRLLQDTS